MPSGCERGIDRKIISNKQDTFLMGIGKKIHNILCGKARFLEKKAITHIIHGRHPIYASHNYVSDMKLCTSYAKIRKKNRENSFLFALDREIEYYFNDERTCEIHRL
jgi:hypothetical protein